MPDEVFIAGGVIGAFAGPELTRCEALGVRRTIIQVGGSDLNVPPDGIHDERQNARIVDQVQESLVVGQGIPQRKRVVLPQSLFRSHARADFVDCHQQTLKLRLAEEILDDDETLLVKTATLLVCHRKIRCWSHHCHTCLETSSVVEYPALLENELDRRQTDDDQEQTVRHG